MTSLEKAVIARIDIGKERFEIYVDPDVAFNIKLGKEKDITKALVVEEVFKDARKGIRVSEESLIKAFGTTDIVKIAETIIKKGEIQLTKDQRRKLIKAKRKQIAYIISRYAINPQTNTPHPPERIEKAIEEAKINIDPFKDAEKQIPNVLKAIRFILPIKLEYKIIACKIPANYYAKVYNIIKNYGNLIKDEWRNEYYLFLIEVPAGVVDEFLREISNATRGNVESKLLESKGVEKWRGR